eukprot:TRINITY_DN6320_c0_g1_i1.p1 TRINITY_DN6320_c0_g1~~TRINITY_DN6320_c0_g1_i1.p1  ORF type:complete len:159 (+),score=21.75 TRINITY_DN6320_c0_g1_i1:45-521(+)
MAWPHEHHVAESTMTAAQTGKSQAGKLRDRDKQRQRSTKNGAPGDSMTFYLMKTKPCKFFAVGACRNAIEGCECPFAHSKHEQTAQPDLRKTRLCRNFEKQCCRLTAVECPFAHGMQELRELNNSTGPKQRLRDIVAMFGSPRREPVPLLNMSGYIAL